MSNYAEKAQEIINQASQYLSEDMVNYKACDICACLIYFSYDDTTVYVDRWVPETDKFHECECHIDHIPIDSDE